jgi:hypothetical protein
LTIAGGNASVAFTPKALRQVHRWSGGIPRLINLICDRALLAGFSIRTDRITPEMVTRAADSLDVPSPTARGHGLAAAASLTRRAPLLAAAAVVLLSAALAVGASAYLYQRFVAGVERIASGVPERLAFPAFSSEHHDAADASAEFVARGVPPRIDRRLPQDAAQTILVGSYPLAAATAASDIAAVTHWLESSGFRVFHAEIDLGSRGRWQRVLAGAYTDSQAARRDEERLKAAAPQSDAHLVSAGFATGVVAPISREPDADARHAGIEP